MRYGACGAAAATAFTSVFRTLTGSSPSKSRSVDGRLSPAWNRRAVPPFSAQGFPRLVHQRLERPGQAPQECFASHLGRRERYRWAAHGHHSLCQSSHAASSVGVSTPRRRHVHQRTRTHWSGYGRIRSKLYPGTRLPDQKEPGGLRNGDGKRRCRHRQRGTCAGQGSNRQNPGEHRQRRRVAERVAGTQRAARPRTATGHVEQPELGGDGSDADTRAGRDAKQKRRVRRRKHPYVDERSGNRERSGGRSTPRTNVPRVPTSVAGE